MLCFETLPQDLSPAATGVEFAGLTITGSGELNFRDTDISIGSTLTDGILDISADSSIRMFYDNADVGDGTSGQILWIYRRAAEGDSYIKQFIAADRNAVMETNRSFQFYAGGSMAFNSIEAGGYTRFLSATNIWFDAGGLLYFRDLDDDYAIRMVFDSATGFLGLNEIAPETLIELTHATPIIQQQVSTHTNTDDARKSIWRAKGNKTDETEHTLGQFSFSHDGSGDDFLAKFVINLNQNGGADTLVQALEIDSNLLATFAGAVKVTANIGFFNTIPVAQEAHIIDADGQLGDITTKFNTLLASLETYGLLATG